MGSKVETGTNVGVEGSVTHSGGIGGSCEERGFRSENVEENDAVWSGMFGFQSFKTSGRVKVVSNSCARPPAPSHSAAHFFAGHPRPSPLVACEKRSTSNGRICFDGCKK